MKKYKKIWITLIALSIVCAMLWGGILIMNSIGKQYRPASSSQELRQEMITRTSVIAEKKDKVYLAAITPFVWDEGFLVDASMTGDAVDRLIGSRRQYIDIASGEQRMVFCYQGKVVVDIILDKTEIDFDFDAGELDVDLWLNIGNSDGNSIRLYK